MKRTYTLILFLFFTTVSFGQKSVEKEKQLIKNIITESFDEIWSDLNSKSIDKFYTKDFLLLENGEVWNNDSISNYMGKALLEKKIPKRENKIEVIEIKVLNGMAWIAYQNYATWTIDNVIQGKAHWLESATAILTKKGWKLQLLHSTHIKNK